MVSKRRREQKKRYCASHRVEIRAAEKRYRDKIRRWALEHYSTSPPFCACCGERTYQFLGIDHINGGGRRHRKSLGGSTTAMLNRMRKRGWPEGFQVLCYNCNLAKGFYGRCPHRDVE